ncbi:uncharacterized protein LOC134753797 [Cydia strobilella]|uniref:uncharacterized protein LOC134753797 n=1 Tax=Cydia strobilella TaxID=1100964 RepID=UPI003006B5D1
MSRIRGIEAKVKKEISHSAKNKNGPDTACEKDDVEKDQVKELLAKIPVLAKTFEIHRKIGEGTFSSVYLGSMRQEASVADGDKRWFAVKHLVPTTHPTRVAHELRCLRDIGGKHNVIGVELCLRNLDHVVFIMPYIPHKKFSEYVRDMDANELRQYMRALLTALRHVHTFGVIHRDVKPSNFLYDRERRRYALVDFGLAQHMAGPAQPPPAHQPLKRTRDEDSLLPGAKRMALDLCVRRAARSPATAPAPAPAPAPPRVCACSGAGGVCGECAVWAPPRANRAGTQGFRPPEVFFKYPHQSTAVDMWAAGVILASVLSGRYPFFRATDDLTALAEITELLGTAALQRTAQALDDLTALAEITELLGTAALQRTAQALDDLTALAEITELLGTAALQRTAQALDDLTALAEITELLGTAALQRTAQALDDLTALAEITELLGTAALQRTAQALDDLTALAEITELLGTAALQRTAQALDDLTALAEITELLGTAALQRTAQALDDLTALAEITELLGTAALQRTAQALDDLTALAEITELLGTAALQRTAQALDDLTALAEITELLGTAALQRTAQALDDLTALAEITELLGTAALQRTAQALDDLTALAEITELLGTAALQRTAQALDDLTALAEITELLGTAALQRTAQALDDLTALAEITELLGTAALQRTAQALDMDTWAAGVILASVLSGRYPFFRATDDLTALAEITELLGTAALQRTAQALGCRLVTSTRRHGLCLRKLSAHLRGARGAGAGPGPGPGPVARDAPACAKCGLRSPSCVCLDDTPAYTHDPLRSSCGFPDAAFALAARLLEPDPRARITAAEALRHPFLAQPL